MKKKFDFNELKKHIPNVLSGSRLLSPLVLTPLIMTGNYMGAVIALSGFLLTDAMDGYLARKWDVQSELGAKIDVVADKIILLSLILPLALINPLFNITLLMEGVISSINVIRKLKGGAPKTLQIGRIKMILISFFMGVNYLNVLTIVPKVIIDTLFVITTFFQFLTSKEYYNEFKHEEHLRNVEHTIKQMEEVLREKLDDEMFKELEKEMADADDKTMDSKSELMKLREDLLSSKNSSNGVDKPKTLIKK